MLWVGGAWRGHVRLEYVRRIGRLRDVVHFCAGSVNAKEQLLSAFPDVLLYLQGLFGRE